MVSIRRAEDRGQTRFGWLDSWHTFAFARGFPTGDGPDIRGFRGLRVINDDIVAPASGFDTHPHDNMEIISYIVDGELQHKDSMGTTEIIGEGEFQLTSAGTGITHSERNPSTDKPVRLIQIWIHPAERNTTPKYALLGDHFGRSAKGRLRLAASPDGADGSMTIGADAKIWVGTLGSGQSDTVEVGSDRHAFVQVVKGTISAAGETLSAGDGAAISGTERVEIAASDDAEVLVFDLA